MRALCVVVLFAVLGACSGQPTVVNPNKSADAARADYHDCRGSAAMAVAVVPKGKDVDEMRQKALDECMKTRGYNVK
jgi:hypothetical protein